LVVLHTAEGEIVGHAIYFVRGLGEASPSGYLFTIYVDPLHRRHGLARALLTDAVRWSEEQGAVRVVAHTHVTNLGLVQLAERCGFKITERSSAPPWPHLTLERATPTR
jgi:GNAT superfamily N-acetyltransferase